jgi:MYXO-CTERM domain-containing protein
MHFSLALLWLIGCGAGSGDSANNRNCEPAATTEVSFEAADMLCVQLEMDPDDFEELGNQFRFGDDASDQFAGVLEHVATSCTEPFPDPYTYFPADVNVDGLEATNVGVRKKGFVGSVLEGSSTRPSLKIKTDVFVEDQTLAGTERVTLNNNLTDKSRMRTCLVYGVFADAGYPAPRCNLANVMVNGESLGAYTHVESIKKSFLARNFGNDNGSLYEATLSDFTDEHLAEGLGRWEAKTSDSDPTTALLQSIADALLVDDEDLEQSLDSVLDLDMFLQFWALETLVAHGDGYGANTNNTYVYFDPDRQGRAVLIPWGPDDAMRGDMAQTFVTSALTRRLSRHDTLSVRYLEVLEQLLEEVWDEDLLRSRIAEFTEHVTTAEQSVEDHQSSVDELTDWVAGRRQQLEQFIEEGGLAGSEEPSGCNAALDLEQFADLAEVMVIFSHSCSAAPNRVNGLLALALLGLVARRRRRDVVGRPPM